MAMKRVNLRLPEDLVEWYKEKSEGTSLSMTALIYIAMTQYKDQQTAIKEVPGLVRVMEEAMKRERMGKE